MFFGLDLFSETRGHRGHRVPHTKTLIRSALGDELMDVLSIVYLSFPKNTARVRSSMGCFMSFMFPRLPLPPHIAPVETGADLEAGVSTHGARVETAWQDLIHPAFCRSPRRVRPRSSRLRIG